MPEAGDEVVVNHSGGLHVGVDHCRPHKLEPPLFQVGRDQVRQFCFGGNHLQAGEMVDQRPEVGKLPDIPVEASILLPDMEEATGIVDARFNLQAVPDDAGILHQPFHIGLTEAGHFFRIKLAENLPEGLPFVQDGSPAQSRLKPFEHQEFE